jgi:hypothetical protein
VHFRLKLRDDGAKKKAKLTKIIVEINDLRGFARLAIGSETGRLVVFKQAPNFCVTLPFWQKHSL